MFEIVTDSAANLSASFIKSNNIHVLSLSYAVDGRTYKNYFMNDESFFAEFYSDMRKKKNITTENMDAQDVFSVANDILSQGKDILYISMSSALSDSFKVCNAVLGNLKRKYPDQKIYTIDSKGVGLGEGLLVMAALDMQDEGWPIEETYKWLVDNRLFICNDIYVDNPYYMKKSEKKLLYNIIDGTKKVNTKLDLYIDQKGVVVQQKQVRIKSKGLDTLVDNFVKYAIDPEFQQVCISHADCIEDAQYIENRLKKKCKVNNVTIAMLDPTIGAHIGPGSIILSYMGEHRRMQNISSNVKHIFIVNPEAGRDNFADELRDKLEQIGGLDYYVFLTRDGLREERLVRRVLDMFQGEKLRFYCCGGSGTMKNMLDGFSTFDDVEIAFYACGVSNDFLKVFGEDEKRFHDVQELISGEVVDIDYIRSNHGCCLNHVSTGVDSVINDKVIGFSDTVFFLSGLTVYVWSILWAILTGKSRQLEIELDGRKINGTFSEVVFGNGYKFGGSLSFDSGASVSDGIGVFVATERKYFKLVARVWQMYKGNIAKFRRQESAESWRHIKLKSADGKTIVVNLDGEIIDGYSEWEFEIVPKGIHFVVPKGVRV